MASMAPGERLRALYAFQPVDHLPRGEFYIWGEALDRWKREGLPDNWSEQNLFQYDPPGIFAVPLNLGWCEPPFLPAFETLTLRQEGEEEIIQDTAGRHLRVFKGRRHGFMPDYLRHPVTSIADWKTVRDRLDPHNPARWEGLGDRIDGLRRSAEPVAGLISQHLVGGYMYLRALIGPEELLLKFYDDPDLIRACMSGWLALMDEGIRRTQESIELDEIFLAEDICYNHGLLISPDAMREFLFPAYAALIRNAQNRQQRPIRLKIDTDGDCRPAIPVYGELGMSVMVPFEVASGCDVVAIGRQHPTLVMGGGIDKRVLAKGPAAIDAHLQHILPAMVRRGGYWPTCDHGVPSDVSLANYLHYRRRIVEWDH